MIRLVLALMLAVGFMFGGSKANAGFSMCDTQTPVCVSCFCVSKWSGKVRLVRCEAINTNPITPNCEVVAARCHRWERPHYNPIPGLPGSDGPPPDPINNVPVLGSEAPLCIPDQPINDQCSALPDFLGCNPE